MSHGSGRSNSHTYQFQAATYPRGVGMTRPTANSAEGRCETSFLSRRRRYEPRIAFSTANERTCPSITDGDYLIVRDSHILMRGRTFCRDDADAICDALEEAAIAGAEEAWEA